LSTVGADTSSQPQPSPGDLARRRALDSFDCSLSNMFETVIACLEAADAQSVTEVGAEHGLLTGELLAWGDRRGGVRIAAVDPYPQPDLDELERQRPDLELVREPSHRALEHIELPDVVILDGDHNYFTVLGELERIAARASGAQMPLILLHDIGWPLARRDTYHDPAAIPPEHRHPLAEQAYLVPGEAGVAERGLYFGCAAAHEGGPRNGVLTAVEDFIGDDDELRLAIVPTFFGMGVLWHSGAPWADRVAETVAPLDRDPVLTRMEERRVAHLVEEFRNSQQIDAMRSQDYELQHLLSTMLESSAFALAEQLSRLRQRGTPMFTRAQVARALSRASEDNRLLDGGEPVDPWYRRNGLGQADTTSGSA
jgi:hypothetical protein